ncbi:response regulator [Luethyella okanaganae]|uniref:Transcriptional regulatory protein n=1 Tax=Luethyella okanaganae TaxID=69372 RepID=A0ABW1VDV2_9MICO
MTAASRPQLNVLVVDDEELAASAHADFVRRIEGLGVVGVAHTGSEAIRALRVSAEDGSESARIHLVLLDMNLPDMHGLELCRRLRSSGLAVDVIAITAVRDVDVVRAAVSLGIVQYLIKPFGFAMFAEKLRAYLAFRARLDETAGTASQHEVDQSFARLRAPTHPVLEKGLSEETLTRVVALLREGGEAVSANELGTVLSLARVTARRYLEHLVSSGFVERSARYGTPGRPELEYRWMR